MEKIRIGVICPSEIAYRRFMPALQLCDEFEYVGIAVASKDEWNCDDETRSQEKKKAESFVSSYGGVVFDSYASLISSPKVDAIYLPLPPGLHFKWGKQVLENQKHLFLEKPSTTSLTDTEELVRLAKKNNLALHENYMFQYHSQLDEIRTRVKNGLIGDVRLYRIAFGFPQKPATDFRYNKSLGGGALLDCGGYTLKLATMLLGSTARITTSRLNFTDEFEVDIFGSATLENDDGICAQISFGMDNSYKCELEIWGSKGTILADRVLTAPAGFSPNIRVKICNEQEEIIALPADDTFHKSLLRLRETIASKDAREEEYWAIIKQAQIVKMAGTL